MQEIGTVISLNENPSSSEFWFVINSEDGMPIRRGQFVQLQTEEGLLISRVAEIIKTNRYFNRAESVREYERSGKPLLDVFPVDRWEYLVAQTIPLGIYDDGEQKRVSFPPSPGEKVYKVDEKILPKFFGFDENSGIDIGQVEFHDIEAKLNITKLFQKHLAILAMSGAGKSYLASVLIEEILDRSDSLGKPCIILIDPHGEYLRFAKDEKYISSTKVYNQKNISIAAHHLSPYQIGELVPQMTAVQRRELVPVIQKLREKQRSYDLEDLIEAVEKSEIKPNTKYPLLSWLSDLNSTGLFSNSDSPDIGELAKSGQISIFDLSDFVHLKARQIILTYFGRKLFEARRMNRIPPYIFFVEEAHQFAPEGEEENKALSKYLIEQVAREGRKFYASLVLISQRPIRLSTTALSQCNTHIILRVANPYDIKHIGESAEGITSDFLEMIPGLKVGEALIVGEAVNYPLLVKIKNRKSKYSEKTASLENALQDFKEKKKLESKDLDTFL